MVLNIVADVLLLVVLAIPVILGIKRGFVDMALRFGKTLVAFLVACLFSKGVGAWLKGKIYSPIHNKIASFLDGEATGALSESAMVEKIPEGIRNTLANAGLSVEDMASAASQKGSDMVTEFTQSVASGVAGILAYVTAFIALFVVSLLLILLLRPILNYIAQHLPVVKTLNKWLGALMGLLIGLLFAWVLAQLLAGILGLLAYSNWTNTLLLSFFYRINPIKWLFLLAVESIAAISVV